jgi:hypothetical protein
MAPGIFIFFEPHRFVETFWLRLRLVGIHPFYKHLATLKF